MWNSAGVDQNSLLSGGSISYLLLYSIYSGTVQGQEAGSDLARWFWLRVSFEVLVKVSAGAASSYGLIGAGGSAQKAQSLAVGWSP